MINPVCAKDSSWNTGKPAWWITSAPSDATHLDEHQNDLDAGAKSPIKTISSVMIGFGETLHHKERRV